jgi:hypothetical protein
MPAWRRRLTERASPSRVGVVVTLGGSEVQGLERYLALELRIPRQMHHALRAAPRVHA